MRCAPNGAGSSRVLLELHTTLKPGGVLFSSNPRGHNEEGWNSGRYGVYHDLKSWRRYNYLTATNRRRRELEPLGIARVAKDVGTTVFRIIGGLPPPPMQTQSNGSLSLPEKE